MKKITQFTIISLFLFLASCNSNNKKILGTWHSSFTVNGVSFKGDTTYLKNGTSTFNGILYAQGESIYIIGSSNWEISSNELTETITSSNIPQLLPVGYKTTDKIIELTDKKMVAKDSDGTITTSYRK